MNEVGPSSTFVHFGGFIADESRLNPPKCTCKRKFIPASTSECDASVPRGQVRLVVTSCIFNLLYKNLEFQPSWFLSGKTTTLHLS